MVQVQYKAVSQWKDWDLVAVQPMGLDVWSLNGYSGDPALRGSLAGRMTVSKRDLIISQYQPGWSLETP